MDITRITENNREAFKDLMPEGLTRRGDLMRFGAVSDQNEAVSALALGVLDEDGVYIDWIYTEPSFREHGAASRLLDKVKAFLMTMQIGRVEISFSDDDEELDDFLKSNGFVTCPEEDMYEVPVCDLIYTEQMDALIEKVPLSDSVHTLGDPVMYQKLMPYLESLGGDVEGLGSISVALSLLRLDEAGDPSGCMLAGTPDDESVEVSYFANTGSPEDAMELVVGLCNALQKNNMTERTLLFTDKAGHILHLVEELTGQDIDMYRVEGTNNAVCVL